MGLQPLVQLLGSCLAIKDHLRATMAGAFALSAAIAVAGGQTLPLPMPGNEAQMIAAAEAEGAAYERSTKTPAGDVSPRRCTTGYERGPAQSGEFTIGGNLSGAVALRAGRSGKIWWAPAHRAADMPPLLVRGRSLTNPRDTVRFTSSNIAWPVYSASVRVPESQRRYFFPSGIAIPQPGRWLLIASSGPNWGCFILTVD